MMRIRHFILAAAALLSAAGLKAQEYPKGLVDKTIAVVGGEMITIGEIESERNYQAVNGVNTTRCNMLEGMLESKLFLMQARIDSIEVKDANVASQVEQRIASAKTQLGGEEQVEKYFGKSMYRLRRDWTDMMRDQFLIQEEQNEIIKTVPDLTPYDVKEYLSQVDSADLPIVPIRYQLSQICIYPDRQAANLAVRERLLELRERIVNGESFATLARLYSEDPGSSRKGGELGMASKSIYWPAFSDAAMALKPGIVSQIVETPDGFHLIEVLEKKGDMFNARHILMRPKYTDEDRTKAFKTLDSLRTQIDTGAVSFELAARFYSQDPTTRTNGGQMADPNTGSSYFEIDQLKPQDYAAIKDLKEGEISEPVESLDNEGRSGNTVYKIIRLDKILPAHPATFENDYSELLDQATAKKRQDAIDKFLDEKIGTTYVTIDPIFKDCPFKRHAWKDKIVEDD